jgi:hypothetical protein
MGNVNSDGVMREISNPTQEVLYDLMEKFDWGGLYCSLSPRLSFDNDNPSIGLHPIEPEHILTIWDDRICVTFVFHTTLAGGKIVVGQEYVYDLISLEVSLGDDITNRSKPWVKGIEFIHLVQKVIGCDEFASQGSLLSKGDMN